MMIARRFTGIPTFVTIAALVAAALCVAAFLPSVAHGAPIYVSVLGSDTAGDGLSATTSFATVQHAIDMAASGDTVQVGAGTFAGGITMKDGVSLHGAGSSETTLTASASGIAISASNIGTSTNISGFSITRANSIGIYCTSSSPSITGNTISGNCDGIDLVGSSPSITGNTISGNRGYGILLLASTPTITNNIVSGSSWGISCNNTSSPTITNNTIVGSTWRGISCGAGDVPVITNCIVWGNAVDLDRCTASYSDISIPGQATGLGNITVAPSFVNTATGDYRLNADSPCIDKGTPDGAPATDKEGTPRPCGSGWDMGAYEYHPAACQLHHIAGSNGTLIGSESQTVDYAESGSAVTASASTGHHFVRWSDGKTDNPRTDTNVTADATYTAGFAIDTHTLTYSAGTGGSIVGSATQVVDYGSSGSAVTASAIAGYHFVRWSDGTTANPRVDTNVTADKALGATFALTTYRRATITRLAGSSSGRLRRTYRLTGTVSPGGSGKVTITLTRLVGKRYVSAGKVTVTVSRGKFAYNFKPKHRGKWLLEAKYSGAVVGVTTYAGSKSVAKTVKVK
jgi:parallel beta-helix repeat protein